MHPSILVLSPSFLYHPYIPSFKSKDFSFTCLLPFFGCTLHLFSTQRNILSEGICCCLHIYIVLLKLCYANFHCYYGPVIGIFIYFKDRLPEAICCCLQTCSVNVVLLVMCCMCIPVFIVTSTDISQLWVYLCYLLIYYLS